MTPDPKLVDRSCWSLLGEIRAAHASIRFQDPPGAVAMLLRIDALTDELAERGIGLGAWPASMARER